MAAVILTRHRGGRVAVAAGVLALLVGGLATGAFGVATANTPHSGGVPTAVQTSKSTGMFGGMGGPGGDGARTRQGTAAQSGTTGESAKGRTGTVGQPSGTPGSGAGAAPSGTRDGGGMPGANRGANAALVALLRATTTDWAAATTGAMSQGSLQLNSGRPVIAIGGFSGGDPAPTLAQFQQWVREGRIGYYIGGGFGPQRSSEIGDWVKANFTATTVGGETVYRLTT